ncbi:hypothetical protein C8J57DRAFT_1076491 [Mycena rebaudengoi]|nr:hypothetical protein C8J57DRAFT_1076491 [Mycena rebaudengoi]
MAPPQVPIFQKRFPPVEPESGQRPNETMDDFFTRRAKRDEETEQLESAREKQTRMAKLANSTADRAPGKKGARVYVWKEVDGHWIRQAAGRNKYEDVWEEYGAAQRRYNAFRDEWDVCTRFGPADEPEDEYDSDVDQGQDPHYPDAEAEVEHDDDMPEAEMFNDMMRHRFGMTTTRSDIPPPPNPPTYSVLYKLLGLVQTRNTIPVQLMNVPKGQLDSATRFIGHLMGGDIEKIPCLDYEDHTSGLYAAWSVDVWQEELYRNRRNQQTYYVVGDTEQRAGALYLLIEKAAIVLEIVRKSWGPSINAVVDCLLKRGIKFSLCRRGTYIAPSEPAEPAAALATHSGLGFRQLHYKPDMRDYNAYVCRRNLFLSTPRGGRAALMYGGVIGRIARSVAFSEDVMRRPSEDLLSGRSYLHDRNGEGYYDDVLSSREIDLICGVYHVETGQSILLPPIRFDSHFFVFRSKRS